MRASGIVTHRQQPSTASGVIFATLEDETGTVNIIVWPSLAEEQRKTLRAAMLLKVYGTWQSKKASIPSWLGNCWITRHCLAVYGSAVGISDEKMVCLVTRGHRW